MVRARVRARDRRVDRKAGALAVDGRTTATWLVACAAAQLLGGLIACLWESGGQWAAPGHDLPIAVLTVCAALGGGKGALGSNWRTQAVLQVGHVCALAFALGLDVFVLARMSDVMAATMARPELAANRRAARGGVGLALAGQGFGAAAVDDTRGQGGLAWAWRATGVASFYSQSQPVN